MKKSQNLLRLKKIKMQEQSNHLRNLRLACCEESTKALVFPFAGISAANFPPPLPNDIHGELVHGLYCIAEAFFPTMSTSSSTPSGRARAGLRGS